MKRGSLLLTAAVVAAFALAGCNKAESPDKVASDVAKATAAAANIPHSAPRPKNADLFGNTASGSHVAVCASAMFEIC